jgi:molybdenum cofactor synthesis domain-containing protein
MKAFMQDSRALLPPERHGDAAGHRGFVAERLYAPGDAIAAFFARVAIEPVGIEDVALDAAPGRVLARDARALEDHPTHPRSTMDGYAVRSGDGAGRRRIVGEVFMGSLPPRVVGSAEAIRVPTGGAVPTGADAVVPQEDVDVLEPGWIALREAVAAGESITRRADDVREGETVLSAGRRIGGPELGVLATLGIVSVPVFVRPRIAILSTGDELVDPGVVPAIGQVRDSNRYAIAAALAALGAQPVHVARSADTEDALRAALRDALEDCEAVFSSGGSSVGDRDLVPHIVAELGEPGPIVHGLRVKPGKPTLLAALGRKPIVGLPGNPASSLMILEAVVRPIVVALCGERPGEAITLSAIATAPFAGRAGWTWYVPVRLRRSGDELEAQPLAIRSSQTSLLARASGYVIVDDRSGTARTGDRVNVRLFSSGGAPIEAA